MSDAMSDAMSDNGIEGAQILHVESFDYHPEALPPAAGVVTDSTISDEETLGLETSDVNSVGDSDGDVDYLDLDLDLDLDL